MTTDPTFEQLAAWLAERLKIPRYNPHYFEESQYGDEDGIGESALDFSIRAIQAAGRRVNIGWDRGDWTVSVASADGGDLRWPTVVETDLAHAILLASSKALGGPQ